MRSTESESSKMIATFAICNPVESEFRSCYPVKIVDDVLSEFSFRKSLSQAFERSQPEHADGAAGAVHAAGDFFERQAFDVPQQDHLAVVAGQLGQGVGQHDLLFVALGVAAGRVARFGEQRFEPGGRLFEPLADLLERNLAPHVPLLGEQVLLDDVEQVVHQNLTQPGDEFARRLAAELVEVAVGLEKGLLDDVRRADPDPQAVVELGGDQQLQVVGIERQQPAQAGGRTLPGRRKQFVYITLRVAVHRYDPPSPSHYGQVSGVSVTRKIGNLEPRLLSYSVSHFAPLSWELKIVIQGTRNHGGRWRWETESRKRSIRQLDTYGAIARSRTRLVPDADNDGFEHWKRFAAATGATLAAVASAEAAITHVMPAVPPRVEIPFDYGVYSELKFVDLNNDAVNDIQLGALVEYAYTFSGWRYFGSAQGTNGLMMIGNGGGQNAIRKFANNEVIPAAVPASIGNLVRRSATYNDAIQSTGGDWGVDDTATRWLRVRSSGIEAGRLDSNSHRVVLQRRRPIGCWRSSWSNGLTSRCPALSIMAGKTSSGSVLGDYNGNGTVGPEDYTTWKNAFGNTVTAGTGADGNGNTKVDAADYTIWRNSFDSGGGSLSGAVPEPATVTLGVLALGAAGVATLRRRSK